MFFRRDDQSANASIGWIVAAVAAVLAAVVAGLYWAGPRFCVSLWLVGYALYPVMNGSPDPRDGFRLVLSVFMAFIVAGLLWWGGFWDGAVPAPSPSDGSAAKIGCPADFWTGC